MAHIFTDKENKDWLATLPKKSVAVKLVARSEDGLVLLVKPNYKKTWQLPGGGVEPNEAPETALTRELNEELSLQVDSSHLKIVGTVFRQEHDNLILIYELLTRLDGNSTMQVAEDEITAYDFVEPNKVAGLLSDYYSKFWSDYAS